MNRKRSKDGHGKKESETTEHGRSQGVDRSDNPFTRSKLDQRTWAFDIR